MRVSSLRESLWGFGVQVFGVLGFSGFRVLRGFRVFRL